MGRKLELSLVLPGEPSSAGMMGGDHEPMPAEEDPRAQDATGASSARRCASCSGVEGSVEVPVVSSTLLERGPRSPRVSSTLLERGPRSPRMPSWREGVEDTTVER